MYCAQCGKPLEAGATVCPSCQYPAAPVASSAGPSVDQVVSEMARAAREFGSTVSRLSERVVAKAEAASKDPTAAAKKAAHRAAKELDAAAREIDRILKDL